MLGREDISSASGILMVRYALRDAITKAHREDIPLPAGHT